MIGIKQYGRNRVDMKYIVHLVTNDKFTDGYINFFRLHFNKYNNIFITSSFGNYRTSDDKHSDIIIWNRVWDLVCNKSIIKAFNQADVIIISGFSFGLPGLFWSRKVWDKIYIQFWGRDFYDFKLNIIKSYMDGYCFKRAKGFIFLIDGEYEQFLSITGIEKSDIFVAPMPYNPVSFVPYHKYIVEHTNDNYRIQVGNSATIENKHEYVLKSLATYLDRKIEILCPLSYGDMSYAQKIIELGRELFGDRFIPITQWLDMEKYYSLIATCDAAIFYSNRQQAMGNIEAMLSMGKKVFLARETSMYTNYCNHGFTIFDADSIGKDSFDEFIRFDNAYNNIEIGKTYTNPMKALGVWDRILKKMLN